MIAVVTVSMRPPNRAERREGSAEPEFSIAGAWMNDQSPVGKLNAAQVLALLEQARLQILRSVSFQTPSLVEIAGPEDVPPLNGDAH